MKFWQVDAFTNEIFKGNPAAVVILEPEIANTVNSDLMQNIAMELNLSETAFVVLGNKNQIRWFTPNSEVNLCGHATLSAAHIMYNHGFADQDKPIEFCSKSGKLIVTKNNDLYTLDFPAQEALEKEEYYNTIKSIIDSEILYIGSNNEDCLIVLKSSDDLINYQPNHSEICKLTERGLVITAEDKSGKYDYIYRTFYPKLNVPEDPVTGSANTCLAPYWSNILEKTKLKAKQVSMRTGELTIELVDDRVLLTGNAVTVFSADLNLNSNMLA